MSIAGEIEHGKFIDYDGIAIKYAFISGDEWQISSGKKQGQS